jgi:hypothetical protein
MADTACDNLDQGLARPGRLDGDLSHVKAVPVVVRHTCQHGGRQRVGRSHFVVGVGRSRQHGRRAARRGKRYGLCAVERHGKRVAREESKRCNVPRPCAFCVLFLLEERPDGAHMEME